MIRTLSVIAAVSFVLAIAAFAAAIAVAGGPFWIDDGGRFHRFEWRESWQASAPDGGPAQLVSVDWR